MENQRQEELEQQEAQQQLLRRFKWFVAAVSIFCIAMVFLLPR